MWPWPMSRSLRAFLGAAGLLAAVRWVRRQFRLAMDPAFRGRERASRQAFLCFKREFGRALGHRLTDHPRHDKTALVASMGYAEGVRAELSLLKGLQLGGYEPVVLTWRDPWLVRYARLTGVRRIVFWDEFLDGIDVNTAKERLDRVRSFEDLLALTQGPTRVGRFATSTAFRRLRVGSLDVASEPVRRRVAPFVAESLAYARASQRVIEAVRPRLAVFVDKGYTPHGQLFDACVAAGIDAITWNAAHKSNSLVFKRYTRQNRDDHPASLSPASWELVRRMPWSEAHRQRLRQELEGNYVSGEWFSEVGTQFNKRVVGATELQQRLQLDARKKTAVIFPHILWDGTFFWGTDLFRNYEEWFLETVRAACRNDQVNWIINFHPANVVKNQRDGVQGAPSEAVMIQTRLGRLPPHVFVIPAESDISTFSLFGLMDVCVTVRGTIGIEAASFGIPVLTAGTGRYDRKGFTIDSGSRDEYLERLADVQHTPPLSPEQRELAERFAYGVFVLRPLPLTTFTQEFQRDGKATMRVHINAVTRDDWLNAQDLKAFAAWAADTDAVDYLSVPIPAPPQEAAVPA